MEYQTVFKRYELKYILNAEQKEEIKNAMNTHMVIDNYGKTNIRNIYFDTDTYRLIRRSIEKPIYKEKLRMRSYGPAKANSTVFVELKKKYKSVVYKRRISLSEKDAMEWLCSAYECRKKTQISSEIDYFIQFYESLRPVLFLSYDREAYYSLDRSDFRVTFDENILCREDNLSLKQDAYGKSILDDGMTLMELKCAGGIPLWMAQALSAARIYKTSFSKYGTAYKTIIYPRIKEDIINDRHNF